MGIRIFSSPLYCFSFLIYTRIYRFSREAFHFTNSRDTITLAGIYLLPPANEVWGKVIFSQASVCPQGGGGLPDRDPLDRDPPYGKEWAVPILLECTLVLVSDLIWISQIYMAAKFNCRCMISIIVHVTP